MCVSGKCTACALTQSFFLLRRQDLESLKLEIDDLKRGRKEMVPRKELTDANESIAGLTKEVDSLKQLLASMVPRSELEELVAVNKRLESESSAMLLSQKCLVSGSDVEELEKKMQFANERVAELEAMVSEMSLLKDKLRVADVENLRLKDLLKGTVPKEHLESVLEEQTRSSHKQSSRERSSAPLAGAVQDQLLKSNMEIERLRQELENRVSKDLLDQAQDEVCRLRSQISNTVCQTQFDAVREDARLAKEHIVELEGRLSVMNMLEDKVRAADIEVGRVKDLLKNAVPKEQLETALQSKKQTCPKPFDKERSSILMLRAVQEQLIKSNRDIEVLKKEVENKVSKELLEQATKKLELSRREAEKLKLVLDQMPVLSIESLLDDVQTLKAELDRTQELNRKEIENNLVPKSKYDESVGELEAARNEVARLKILEASHRSCLVKSQEQVASATKLMISIRHDSQGLRVKCDNDLRIAMQLLESAVPAAALDSCRDELRRLRDEHDRLQKLFGGTVSRAQHEATLDQVRDLEAELERARRGMESMVPRAELASQVDISSGQAAEIERLNRLVKSMVPRAHLDAANDALQASRSDVARLDSLLAGMVKRSELESARDESSELLSKLTRAQGLLQSMVPRAELARFQDDVLASIDSVRSLQAEVQRMKARCECNLTRLMEALHGMASPMTVARVRDDAQRTAEERDCLQRLVQGMVPRAHLDITQRELENLKWEVEQLRSKLEMSVPRVQLAEARAEAEALRAELAALESSRRVQGTIRSVVSM